MQRNVLSVAALTFALSAIPTFAQSPLPTDSPQTVASNEFLTQLKDGQWRGSKFKGLDVYNSDDERIGNIEDLLIDQSGKIDAVVIGMGGFLGFGKHHVAVPFDEVKLVNEPVRRPATSSAPDTMQPNLPKPDSNGAVQNDATKNQATQNAAPAPIVPKTAEDYPDHAVVKVTKEQLKAAPQFKYASNE